MKKTAIALLCSALPFAANANDKFYFDAGVTSLNVDLGLQDVRSVAGVTVTEDDSDTAGTFLIGYNVNDNVALEAGVMTSTDASANITANFNGLAWGQTLVLNGTLDIKADAKESYFVGGKFSMPVSNDLSIDARAGMMWWEIDYTASGSANGTYGGVAFTANTNFYANGVDGSDPYFGLGATYKVSDDLALKANYSRTEWDDADIDAYTLAASMRF